MKIFLPGILMLYSLFSAAQVPGEWVWIHGSNVPNSTGNYGIQGIPDPANEPPATYEPCEFTDNDNNFWFYGGSNNTLGTIYADLWKYDPIANLWTWVKGPGVPNSAGNYGVLGVPSPFNAPPSRSYGAGTWTDNQGNFWMFGAGSGLGNDLWRYEITTNEWTWMHGSSSGQPGIYGTQGVPDPANFPDPRYECVATWKDNSGDLWMFGGLSGYNDLWRFNIATNTWTWMKGGSTTGQPTVYGTQGVESPANTPGSRSGYAKWKDQSGNFWLCGGEDFTLNIDINEMWRFNPVTNNWAWMGGNPAGNTSPVYGVQCISDSLNDPGGRFENRSCWIDQLGNFYFFGGGIDALTSVKNDLWKYCFSTSEWTWLKGSTLLNPAGSWGTMGVSDPSNVPNGRGGAVGWSDGAGHFYLFGGSPGNYSNPYNDLWMYTLDNNCGFCNTLPIALFTAPHHVCPGTCTNFNNNSINATTYQWIFQGGFPAVSTDVDPANICYNTPGNYDVTLIASNINGSDTLTLPNYIVVYPYSPSQSILQYGDSLISNTGFVSYQWFYDGDTIPGATDYWYVATQSGDYSVVCIDNNGCSVEAVVLNVIASIQYTVDNQQPILVYPNPVVDEFTIRWAELVEAHDSRFTIEAADEIIINNVMGETVFSAVNCLLSTVYCRLLPSGMYYLVVNLGEKSFRTKFVKQ